MGQTEGQANVKATSITFKNQIIELDNYINAGLH